MKRQSVLRATMLVAPLILVACSSDQLGVVVLSARAPGDACDFSSDTLYVSGGSVDMRPFDVGAGAQQSATFYQVFSWENNLVSVPLVVNGQTVDNGTGNNFIADQVFYSYQYSGAGQTFEDEVGNTRAVINAGGTTSQNSVGVDLIQPKAAAKLKTIVNTTAQTLLVTFQISGKMAAGNSLTTNKVSFPVTVYQSDTTTLLCPGQVPSSQCGEVGRDSPIVCTTVAP